MYPASSRDKRTRAKFPGRHCRRSHLGWRLKSGIRTLTSWGEHRVAAVGHGASGWLPRAVCSRRPAIAPWSAHRARRVATVPRSPGVLRLVLNTDDAARDACLGELVAELASLDDPVVPVNDASGDHQPGHAAMPEGLGIDALMGGFLPCNVPWSPVPGGGGSRDVVPAAGWFPLYCRVFCVVLR